MRKMMGVIGIVLFAVANLAGAVELREGQDYTVYNPPRATDTRDKIEVTEFFWYGCSHCFQLEPEVQQWLKKLPKDVSFRRVPAVFPGRDGKPGNWASGARLYYTLEAMNLVDKLHGAVFNAIHVDRADLLSEGGMVDWMGKHGVDTKTFTATYNSFAVQNKVLRSMQMSEAHGLDGVPALIVDGKYKPTLGENVLALTDQLIDKVRKERSRKK